MAVNSPFKIKYGSQEVGGTSDDYQLHEPYVLEQSFTTMRVEFDVVVVATSYATLKSLSDVLEIAFRKRDQTIIITLDAGAWTYTFGTDILNSTATISKTGDKQTDRGYSRRYNITLEAELPADDAAPVTGMRELEWNISLDSSRRKVVTMRGVYTATKTPAQLASVNYLHANGADAEATTFLLALDSNATWQMLTTGFTPDRNDHLCDFQRHYVQLSMSPTVAALPNDGAVQITDIVDHDIVFHLQAQHPGDSQENLSRMRTVTAVYSCAIDIDRTTDLQSVYDNQVKPYMTSLFRSTFNPQVFGITGRQSTYAEVAKRLTVAVTYTFQAPGSDDIVELTASLVTSTQHSLDFTPTHNGDPFAAYVDVGWAVKLRTSQRTALVIGEDSASAGEGGVVGGTIFQAHGPEIGPGIFKRKWGKPFGKGGTWTGGYDPMVGGGWETISNTAKATPTWIGEPDEEQIAMLLIEEEVVQQFHSDPGAGGRGVFPKWSYPGPT